jgi:hypothetical protein
MGWTSEETWFDSRQKQEIYLLFKDSRPALDPPDTGDKAAET